MTSDIVISAPRVGASTWLAEAAFVGLLILVFVGLQPFAPRLPEVLKLGETATTGEGDMLRQISYLAVFAVTAFCAFRKYGLEMVALVPLLLGLTLTWCLMSSLWSAEGGVTFRRAGLECVVVVTAMWGVETVGIERSLKLFRAVLIGILIVNWISIPLLATAIHQPDELDPSVVGAWRGLFFHKNIAGAVSAISAMVFLFFALAERSRLDWLFFIAAVVFLVMTQSKSSMGLLAPALIAGAVYRAVGNRDVDRWIAVVAVLLLLVVGTAIALADWSAIVRVVSDPQEFTGRTVVWTAEVAFIADHPILGSGFGSFSNTGVISPLHNYVSGDWIKAISHGHNGYLQLVVEIGIVGFLLAILALVVGPAVAFWRRDAIPIAFKAFLFTIFIFMVLHNVMESDFLQADGPMWVSFLLMLAWLRQARAVCGRERQSTSW